MNPILILAQQFLETKDPHTSDPTVIEGYWECFYRDIAKATKRALSETERDEFRYRLSALGKPLCQLQYAAKKTPGEADSWTDCQRWLHGHWVEAYAKLVMRLAGVTILDEAITTAVTIEGLRIQGEADIVIDVFGEPRVYDVKGVSDQAFTGKFRDYASLKLNDEFGYLEQLYAYAKGLKVRPGGWIVLNKQTGAWAVIEVPFDWEKESQEAFRKMAFNVSVLEADGPVKRCFDDKAETYYQKPTGNRVLGHPCVYCSWKFTCWPELQALPQIPSKAERPKTMYYTLVKEAA